MKILIEMEENKIADLARVPVKVLGTEQNMALDTVFTAEDIWNLIADPNHEGFHVYQPFAAEKLSKIESYGKEAFLGAVISRLNHHFDANEGTNWDMVYTTAIDAYNDLCIDMEQTETVDHISTDGLRTALQRYDENGKRGKCGSWEIHDGGYDRWWEICHDGQVLVACYASGEWDKKGEFGNIERERQLSDKTFSDICKIVCEEFSECRMAPEEQKKINERKQSLGR